MLATVKIAVLMVLMLMLIPAMVRSAQSANVAVHAVRKMQRSGPQVVGLEVRLCGRRAFFSVERREPL